MQHSSIFISILFLELYTLKSSQKDSLLMNVLIINVSSMNVLGISLFPINVLNISVFSVNVSSIRVFPMNVLNTSVCPLWTSAASACSQWTSSASTCPLRTFSFLIVLNECLLGRLSLRYAEISMRNTSKCACVIQEGFLNLCCKFK